MRGLTFWHIFGLRSSPIICSKDGITVKHYATLNLNGSRFVSQLTIILSRTKN